jgi:hypothetical protein
VPLAVAVVALIGLAACSDPKPPPPLGGSGGGGLQCVPLGIGQPVTDGLYPLENSSSHKVQVTRVRLVGGEGQKITSPVFLVPIAHTTLIGVQNWPPKIDAGMWKYRKPAVGGTVPAHKTLNLVFAEERTSARTKAASVQVTYTVDGNSYILTEGVRFVVAANC